MKQYPHSLELDLALLAFRKAVIDLFPDANKTVLLQLDVQLDTVVKSTAILYADAPPKADAHATALNKLKQATEILTQDGLNALKRPNMHNHNNLIELAHHWSRRYGALR